MTFTATLKSGAGHFIDKQVAETSEQLLLKIKLAWPKKKLQPRDQIIFDAVENGRKASKTFVIDTVN